VQLVGAVLRRGSAAVAVVHAEEVEQLLGCRLRGWSAGMAGGLPVAHQAAWAAWAGWDSSGRDSGGGRLLLLLLLEEGAGRGAHHTVQGEQDEVRNDAVGILVREAATADAVCCEREV
jgi:hypothetical protein